VKKELREARPVAWDDNGDIVGDLTAVLEFYRAMGIEGLAVRLPAGEGRAKTVFAGRPPERRTAPRPDAAGASPKEHAGLLAQLGEEIGDCVRCKLSKQRKKIVFGEGNPEARLMFIGEAPGRDEDLQGMPFVGEAGMLLTKLIRKMGFDRSDVYIANIIKCRPPLNRDPEADEVETCRPFIERQIEIIRPTVIVTLGRVALQTLMDDPKLRITAARGHFLEYRGIPVMPTFHPAYLLRNPADKWKTWSDAQRVLEKLGMSAAGE
jgi:uracil-DNA glycosylase family 4